ncbi:MAG: hypothetical protein HW380_758 [Magnetococcales bacterium]|nr:hypothetical protein [Magnetococcales bacterium]HIJ84219.1 c-type cytochrome [Magnetococcales bacterium]
MDKLQIRGGEGQDPWSDRTVARDGSSSESPSSEDLRRETGDRRNQPADESKRRRGMDRRGEWVRTTTASVPELCQQAFFAYLDKTGRASEKRAAAGNIVVLARFLTGKQKAMTQATSVELYDFLVWYERKHADPAKVLIFAKFLVDFYIVLLADGLIDKNPLVSVYKVILDGGNLSSPVAGQTLDTAIEFASRLQTGAEPNPPKPSPSFSPPVAFPRNLSTKRPKKNFRRSVLAWSMVSVGVFLALGAGLSYIVATQTHFSREHEFPQAVPIAVVPPVQDASDLEKKQQNQKKIRVLRREYYFANNMDGYYCKNYLGSCMNTPAKLNRFSMDLDGIDEGRQIFKEFCERCHGHDGKGFGPDSPSLRHVPGRLDVAGEGILQKDAYLFWTIAEGGKMLDTEMPSFSSFLPEKKIWKVMAFIETL